MKPRRLGYSRGRRAAAALLLLLLCLCLSSAFLVLLHDSSAPLEEKAAAAGARVVEATAEVEEAPLPPGNTKVAFLFIARNRLPLELVWDAFFRVRIPESNPPLYWLCLLTCSSNGLLFP
jgi:hypothetical protein